MNAEDLARLELAKRAYKAAQPSSAEVQTGVRRARIWLRRPRPRRSWFSKTLVLVVLALGGLAYAKPHALGALLEQGLPALTGRADRAKPAGKGVVVGPVRVETKADKSAVPRSFEAEAAPAALALAPPAPAAVTAPPAPAALAVPPAPAIARHVEPGEPREPRTTAKADVVAASSPPLAPGVESVPDATTSWGRVGHALANGDQARALSVLGELAQSDDPRTRDKANLGRAQLLMSRGERETACQLARSLSARQAGSHIERQAQALLSSCSR